MMMEYQDLGLSLKLGFSDESFRASVTPQNLNLSTSSSSSHSSPFHSSPCWADRNSDAACGGAEATAAFLKGIDVNRAPAAADGEEEAGLSSPNSTVSSVSGSKRSEREDQETERACSRGISDEEDGGEASRKKLRLTKDQSAILEETFKEHNTLNPVSIIYVEAYINA